MQYVESKEIAVEQLQGNRSSYLILDVREPEELRIASIPGARHMPMNDIPKRLGEIPIDRPIAVLCHHGIRSAKITQFLDANGLNAFNIAGGIDAWSERVDRSIPRY